MFVTLEEPAFVQLRVFDLAGRAVRELCSEFFPAGETPIELNSGELPGGIYAVAGEVGVAPVPSLFAVI